LTAEFAWKKWGGLRSRSTKSALKELHQHLKTYEIPKKTAITKIFGIWYQQLDDQTSFAVEYGIPPRRSIFLFYYGPKNYSDLIGVCSEDQLRVLLDDWDSLEQRVKDCKIRFKIKTLQVKLQSNVSLVRRKTKFFNYLLSRESIGSLASLAGIVPFVIPILVNLISATGFLVDVNVAVQAIIGIGLWLALSYFQYGRLGDFVIKK
jgi:hypothetical protein